MAKRRNGNRENSRGLKSQTKHGIIAIIFFVFALFFLMSMPWFDLSGTAGQLAYEKLYYLLGVGYILLPALFILLGFSFVKSETPNIGWVRAVSGILFLLSGLGIIDITSGKHAGGLLGEILPTPLVPFFDTYASIVFLGAILIISILAIFDTRPDLVQFFKNIWNFLRRKKPV